MEVITLAVTSRQTAQSPFRCECTRRAATSLRIRAERLLHNIKFITLKTPTKPACGTVTWKCPRKNILSILLYLRMDVRNRIKVLEICKLAIFGSQITFLLIRNKTLLIKQTIKQKLT